MSQRTRILLLVAHLGGGGAERVMALLASGFSAKKYEVHLGIVAARDAGAVELPAPVRVHVLGAGRARTAAMPLLHLVWRIRPAVVLSGAIEVNFLVLLLRQFFPRGTSILVRQSGMLSHTIASRSEPSYTRLLFRLLYRRADRIICQTSAMAEDLARELRLQPERILVRANPVDFEGIRAAIKFPPMWNGEGPHLLAVGRLSHEKGFDLLLEALARVRRQIPGTDLTLVGAGGEETALRQLCRSLELEAAVRFTGYIERPYAFFPGATAFVLPSRSEGMPNAMLEAAAAGLPIVATPASGGVMGLLRGRRGAWLAPEVSAEALAATLVAALKSLRLDERICHRFICPAVGMRV
jgi:glycosyltransferase involved in cell wall biosynthesis